MLPNGGFLSHGATPNNSWMVFVRENPIYNWMRTRSTPIEPPKDPPDGLATRRLPSGLDVTVVEREGPEFDGWTLELQQLKRSYIVHVPNVQYIAHMPKMHVFVYYYVVLSLFGFPHILYMAILWWWVLFLLDLTGYQPHDIQMHEVH